MPRKRVKKLNCCERCQNYWTCETKWFRGEHDKDNVCCSLCAFYTECWDPIMPVSGKPSKKTTKR